MANANGDAPPDLNDTSLFPVWNDGGQDDVQSLFQNPYFVEGDAIAVGSAWYANMAGFGLFLYDKPGQPNNVFASGAAVYAKLIPSGNMPYPVTGYTKRFPADACERFRLWYNQGGRVTITDPYPNSNIPNPQLQPPAPPPTPERPFVTPANPVWDAQGSGDDIKQCFTNPCWIPYGSVVATSWQGQMSNFQYDASVDPTVFMDLQNYVHVKGWARNIYTHLASKSMPISEPFFSDEACEAVRLWYNQGCPETKDQIGKMPLPTDPIPAGTPEKPFLVRKDINTLTTEELTTYREALLNITNTDKLNSTWQVGGFLHANWCLHYMEASFPWHRAHLLWLETQIKSPIPYWNFFSSKAADPTSQDSGIPQAFLDETFVSSTGQTLPNPLRDALARNGVSRGSPPNTPPKAPESVQRAPQFATPASRAEYIAKYAPGFLDTIYAATQMKGLGSAQYDGFPFTWSVPDTNAQDLNDLKAENAAAFYANVQHEFDGVLEQAHDNLHGWTGVDMANNSYAAFDPIFWSFHANFDRLFEDWIRNNPDTQWSSNYPLRPFVGREGTITVNEGDKYTYRYTTIGNMVVNSKALGYAFAPPGNPDYAPPKSNLSHDVAPIVMLPDIQCTDKTYTIHFALNPNNDDKPLEVGAPGYVGSITRLGMGPDNGNNRCITGYVTRRLEACKAANDLGGIKEGTPVPIKMKVIEDDKGVRTEVPESKYKDWKGFKPVLVWATPIAGVIAH